MLPHPANLHIDVSAARLRLTGDLDMETADSLVAAAEGLVLEGHRDVTVDCAGLTFCDSYGLRALQRVAGLVGPDGSASIARPSATLSRILQISGIADSFTIAGDDLGSDVESSV